MRVLLRISAWIAVVVWAALGIVFVVLNDFQHLTHAQIVGWFK